MGMVKFSIQDILAEPSVVNDELTELLADIKVLHAELVAISRNKNPIVRLMRRGESKHLERLLHKKFIRLSNLCAQGKTQYYL